MAEKVYIEDVPSIWRSKKVFSIKILSKVWESVLAASIWTIWLIRNDKLFNAKDSEVLSALQLIKFRSLSWRVAYGLILKSKSSWWSDNPTGTVTASFKTMWFNIMSEEQCSVAAFIDGSWKKSGKGSSGGIGGLVKSKDGAHILEFSGPVLTNSALQSEMQAFIQLVALLVNRKWSSNQILILTDSVQLFKLSKVQFISADWEILKDIISLRHVNRVFNSQADVMAKQGAYCNKLWVRLTHQQ